MEQYSVEDVIKYFNEVVLRAEYSDGDGNSSLVQRWDVPIRYVFEGEYIEEDVKILNELFAELTKIEDFPGISEATPNDVPNLYICFYGRKELDENFLEFVQGESVDGVNRYWYYTDTNDIYEGKIGYLKDLEGDIRKSVLLEEIVNGLGMGDTELREDSIVYQYGSEVTALSDMDWLILKLMYNKRIRCGMDAAQCEEIIRELYY